MRHHFLNTPDPIVCPQARPDAPADRLTDRDPRSGNGPGPRRLLPSDRQERHRSTGAEAGRAVLTRRGSRRGPHPSSDGNRLTGMSGHEVDGRDGSHERFVPHRPPAVQSTAHANAYVERFIGSVRRECLDHVIVFRARGLQRLMNLYCTYYERSRTHVSLDTDTPIPRPVTKSSDGVIVSIPQVGGLHHRYERRAA